MDSPISEKVKRQTNGNKIQSVKRLPIIEECVEFLENLPSDVVKSFDTIRLLDQKIEKIINELKIDIELKPLQISKGYVYSKFEKVQILQQEKISLTQKVGLIIGMKLKDLREVLDKFHHIADQRNRERKVKKERKKNEMKIKSDNLGKNKKKNEYKFDFSKFSDDELEFESEQAMLEMDNDIPSIPKKKKAKKSVKSVKGVKKIKIGKKSVKSLVGKKRNRVGNGLGKGKKGIVKGEIEKEIFCFCNKPSFGDMVACDGKECKRKWFHFPCVGLSMKPTGTWYCEDCEESKNDGLYEQESDQDMYGD